MRLKPGLLMTFAALCITAEAGRAQYVEDSIQVPGAWVGSLAYNTSEDVLYGRCQQAGVFFTVSCDSNKVMSYFPLSRPRQMIYDSIDNRVYCPYEGEDEESLAVIDGCTHSPIKSLDMPGATTAAWDPASDRVYVSCQSTAKVAVVDARADSLLTYIPVGRCPMKLYVNSMRQKLYVLNYDDGTVSVVNLETNQVTATVDIGVNSYPNAGYYCRRVDRFYCGGKDGVVVLDGRADSVVGRIRFNNVNSLVEAVGGSDIRGVVVASSYGEESRLYAIDASSDKADTFFAISGSAYGICYSPASDRFYCTCDRPGSVVVLSGDGWQLLQSLPVGHDPYVIAESPVQKRLYVGHLGRSLVYVIHDATTPWPWGVSAAPAVDTALALRLTPNPFRDQLSIAGGSSVPSGEIKVYAGDGRQVRTLNGEKSFRQALRLTWDGRDESGTALPPGVYVIDAGQGARAKVVKLK